PARTLPGARTAPGGSPAVPRWAEFGKESPPLASHRKSRTPGTRVAGIRTPALATAALTSVALLSQTADAAPGDDGKPSLEEVEKKVGDLYRQAESATEKYNAANERTAKQRERADALLDDVAKRTRQLNDAREELGAYAAAQY